MRNAPRLTLTGEVLRKMLRYLNMFILIGLALIGISIAGFATGNRLLTEPGQTVNPYSALIYLGAGVIMLVNGLVSIRLAAQHPVPAPRSENVEKINPIIS